MPVPKQQIIEYGMCSAYQHEELVKYVNDGLQQGWQLHGDTFTTVQLNILFFHQPMIKMGIMKAKPATKPKIKR